jgi:hypothetical protein
MKSRQQNRTAEAGVALIAVLLVLTLLMALAVSLGTAVNMDSALRGGYNRATVSFYAAESGLNHGMDDYRDIFLTDNIPSSSAFTPRTVMVGNRTVTYQMTNVPPNPHTVVIPPGQLFGGLDSIEYTYVVNSTAQTASTIESNVSAEFDVENIPLFQFIAFYSNDLEILPGPNMTLNGWVHTNGNLYLNSGATLNIADNPALGITTCQVTAAGNIYRGRKDGQTTPMCDGTVNVDMDQDIVAPFNDLDPMVLPCGASNTVNRLVPSSELANWKGSMMSNIQPLGVPQPDIIAKGTGTFWTSADLRIVLKLNQNTAVSYSPGPPPTPAVYPHVFQVQNADGSVDATRTASLLAFMNDAAWNAANSTYKFTKPLFYTDVPIGDGSSCSGYVCNCTNANPINCNKEAACCYSPKFVNKNTAYVFPTPTPVHVGNTKTPVPSTPTPLFPADASRIYGTDMRASAPATPTVQPFDDDPRRGGFYNWREGKWMLLLNLNIGDLLAWNTANSGPLFNPQDTTDGGLVIFVSIDGPNSTVKPNNYGIRVFGGKDLPITSPNAGDPTGLTLVSDQALYVLGDYNRGAAGDLPWQPAALIGDSINVLSSNYFHQTLCGTNNVCTRNDKQSNISLDQADRNGTSMTINSAFLGGVDTTVPGGAYNGGLENYPRFHENWSVGGTQQTLTYSGSFVSLGTPAHATGAWCGTGGSIASNVLSGCNIYNPPIRAWNYDPRFSNAANLPPLTPRFVYIKQVLFTENFQ